MAIPKTSWSSIGLPRNKTNKMNPVKDKTTQSRKL
jgi:hypothetical protein